MPQLEKYAWWKKEPACHTEGQHSQKKKERERVSERERKKQMNLFAEKNQTYRCWKQTYGYPRGNMGRRGLISSWNEHTCHNILYKIDNQQGQGVLLNILG